MGGNGFYKRRRGLLEHLRAGKIGLFDEGLHDFLCLRASPFVDGDSPYPPGVWRGSAAAIKADCPRQGTEREIRRSLEHLEQLGWIKRWKRSNGEHGNYPILLARFTVFDSAGNEFRVNAEATSDWRSPVLVPCRDVTGTCPRRDREMTGIKRIETRDKKEHSLAGSPEANAADKDPRQEIADTVHAYFCQQVGKKPTRYLLTTGRRRMLYARMDDLRGIVRAEHPELTEPKQWEKIANTLRFMVDRFAADDFHMGRDPKTGGQKYDGMEYLFGNKKWERWI